MVDKLVNSEANKRRIKFVEECFGASSTPLIIPGRVLVGEGVLIKICRKKPKPRQFFLFNDILVYGNIVIAKKRYNKQRIIPLEEVQLRSVSDAESSQQGLRNGWIISSGSKSFAVYAATSSEKSEWMAHIDKCVRDLIAKSGKAPPQDHAAVWVPDSEANTCMHCKKTQFTVINRRHHCRKCGTVVCGVCSNKKFLLPNVSSKPQRVCDSCYSKLSANFRDIHDEDHQPDADDSAGGEGRHRSASKSEDSSGESSDDDGNNDANNITQPQETLFYRDEKKEGESEAAPGEIGAD